jgi:hypothetical protein
VTTLEVVLLAAIPGWLTGVGALFAAGRSSRRNRTRLEQAREELHVMLSQQRTEFREEIEQVTNSVAFLEKSTQQSEETLRDRMTPSLRARTIQLLRTGLLPDTAASTLAMPKSDVRLIAAVSRVLASAEPAPSGR